MTYLLIIKLNDMLLYKNIDSIDFKTYIYIYIYIHTVDGVKRSLDTQYLSEKKWHHKKNGIKNHQNYKRQQKLQIQVIHIVV